MSPASPASHAGNACSQPACRCETAGGAQPTTEQHAGRPADRRARAAPPTAPGSLSRSSEDPWGGWHGPEVGTSRGEATPVVFSTPKKAPAHRGLQVVYTELSSPDSRWGQGPRRASGAVPP